MTTNENPTATEIQSLDFLGKLSLANKARNALWDPKRKLTDVFHALELAGEVGELCNMIKKTERARFELRGSRTTYAELIGEFGDVLIVLSLLANACNINLRAAAQVAFNKKSTEMGFDVFL